MQRIQKRRAGQRQTQNALIGLLSAVSMTRIGLTQLLPLCGSAAWWLSAACMLPGLCVYGAFRLLLRRAHTRLAPHPHTPPPASARTGSADARNRSRFRGS